MSSASRRKAPPKTAGSQRKLEDFLRQGEYRVRFMSWILPSEHELVLLFFDLPKGKPGPLRVDEGQNLRRARLEAPQTSSRNDLCVLPIRHHEISSNSGIHLCLPLSPFTRVADSAEWVLGRRGGGDLRSNRVLGGDAGTIKMGTGGTIGCVCRCRARLRAPWILSWKNENCPQSAGHKYYLFTVKAAWATPRPSVKSRARSGDYPSVSRWAQAAQSYSFRNPPAYMH